MISGPAEAEWSHFSLPFIGYIRVGFIFVGYWRWIFYFLHGLLIHISSSVPWLHQVEVYGKERNSETWQQALFYYIRHATLCPSFPALFLAADLVLPSLLSSYPCFSACNLLLLGLWPGSFFRTLVLRLGPSWEPYQTPLAYCLPRKHVHSNFLLSSSVYIFWYHFASS